VLEKGEPEPPDASGTVADRGEDGLIADVLTRYPGASFMPVGPGDDAAVLDLRERFPGRLVVCTDTVVEGHDFRRAWSSGRDVGVKIAAQNFADIAAMGGRSHALLVSLVTPGDLPAAWAGELAEGLAAECTRAGAVVAGGDVSAGSELVVTGTAIGTLASQVAVLRSGARAGDVVALSGRTGRSAAGLDLLRAGFGASAGRREPARGGERAPSPATDDVTGALTGEHRRPHPPYEAGVAAALAGATAMIDTSDGLLRDGGRIAHASGVLIDLDSAALHPDSELIEAARWLGMDPAAWVLSGGEDHQLLACFPAGTRLPAPFRAVGVVRAGPPAIVVDGAPVPGPGGFRHFA
jgi:thiamine-monophosphate kinase